MKKLLVSLVKISLSAAIVLWLLWDALNEDPQALSQLRTGAKNWWLLGAALIACSGTVIVITIRWYCLVRAVGIPCRLRDVFRVNLVGYLFNLAPMGVVGGDLLKAWLLARQQHGYRAETFASVVVDRLIGLYMLFVLASMAILGTGLLGSSKGDLRSIAQAVLTMTAIATLAWAVLLAPEWTVGRVVRLFGKVPYLGRPLERLMVAVRLYRHKLPVLLAAALMSLIVHSLFVTCIHLVARALPGESLSYAQHFAVAPLGAATSVIPLPAGPQEGALKYFYDVLAQAPLKGLVISLVYRIITVLIAAVGMGYYLASRREVAEVLHEVEEAQASEQAPVREPVA